MMRQKKKRSRQFKDENKVLQTEEPNEKRKKRKASKAENKEEKRDKVTSKRRSSRAAKRRLIYTTIIILIIVVVGASGLNIYNVIKEEKQIKEEQAALINQKEKLQYQLDQVDSLEYIEQQARQLLRMIKPGEILYILPEKSEPAQADLQPDANNEQPTTEDGE